MKNLIHEIHRRSLWQVIGLYLAVSWIVLQVIDVVGNNFGLPEWVAPAALVLLLLGLPVVVATAFVQEGMTAREPETSRPSPADAGELPPAPSSEPAAHRRLFTWRNALLGGAAAFVLLGIMTAGYLILRASGVGPAGTLVAQGVLEEGADVVLADFESPDASLGEVVTGALRIDLVQSSTVRLVPRTELASALRRMQRDPDTLLTEALARELAVREGYGAVIEGEIGAAGSGYLLTARIVGGERWEPLAAFRATARSEDELIDAIEELSRDIRDKAGESLRSVRRSPGLDQVSTASLEALRLYTRAEDLSDSDPPGAVELYERAVEIDPDFAMAHRKIGVLLGNMGIRRQDEIDAVTRAYELKDRLPAAERELADAYYHAAVMGDRAATVRAYERLLEIDPENTSGLNNLALEYRELGRREEAEALLERAVAVEPFSVGYENLARVRFELGRPGDAEAALDAGAASLPQAEYGFEHIRVGLTTSAADYATAEALASAYAERFPLREHQVRAAQQAAVLHAIRGELAAAEDRFADVRGVPAFFAHPTVVARNRAMLRLVRGDSAGATRLVLDMHATLRDSLPPGDRAYDVALSALLDAGAASEARGLYEEWVREIPAAKLGLGFARYGRLEAEARLALARGAPAEAIRLWETYELECRSCAIAATLGLARAHERDGNVGAAIEQYERFLAERTWNRWVWDIGHRGAALERLAQLYDGRGEAASAIEYYEQFADLWANADEVLQPRVRAARARLEELRAGAATG